MLKKLKIFIFKNFYTFLEVVGVVLIWRGVGDFRYISFS